MRKDPFTPPVIACETCRFWEAQPVDEGEKVWSGDCHRYAPRPETEPDLMRHWVETFVDDWCGEWSEALDR